MVTITQTLIANLNIFFYTGLNLELGDTLMQECLKLWNTVLLLSGDGDLGGLIPLRTTSRPFLTQKQTSPGGADNFLKLTPFRIESD